MAWSKMTSMELSDDDKLDLQGAFPEMAPDGPEYPFGLRISLTHRELEKMGLEADCSIGDVIDLRCFARVCSVSRMDTPMGPQDRVELQITDMAAENEMTEDENG